jgi:hypothetical protein
MSDEFEAAAARVCSADPHSCDAVVFGDQSLLVATLNQATTSGDYQAAVDGINVLLADKPKLQDCLAEDAGYPLDHGRAVLEGLRSALAGLGQWGKSRAPGAKNRPKDFRTAIECFDSVWGDGARPAVKDHSPVVDDDSLWPVFAELGKKGTSAGFWITWDMVDRLRSRSTGKGTRARLRGSATTPVLLVQKTSPRGLVLWLTVDLLDGGGCGFDPDPLALGLTAVRNVPNGGNDEMDFLTSMRDVWKKSGLSEHFRGRWRIVSQCPATDTKLSGGPARYPRYLRRLTGRSAEAAALAAIWAAHGKIPDAPEFQTLGKLALDVAISGSVGDCPAGEPETSLVLQGVQSVGEKLRAAKEKGLDTVVLAEQEEQSPEETEIRQEVREADKRQRAYAGLHIERVMTMGAAMDLLLETNRWQRYWQEHVEASWRELWQEGTATFEAMNR